MPTEAQRKLFSVTTPSKNSPGGKALQLGLVHALLRMDTSVHLKMPALDIDTVPG